MALKYVVKKTIFGFDKTRSEKYVARPLSAGSVDFTELCDQVTKVGMVPRGIVKSVVDGLIDAILMNLTNGLTVKLGDFGCFRAAFGCKSQEKADDVKTETLRHRKIVFTPGLHFRNMLREVSIQKFVPPVIAKPDDNEIDEFE